MELAAILIALQKWTDFCSNHLFVQELNQKLIYFVVSFKLTLMVIVWPLFQQAHMLQEQKKEKKKTKKWK